MIDVITESGPGEAPDKVMWYWEVHFACTPGSHKNRVSFFYSTG